MKLLLLINTNLVLILFLNDIFSQSNAFQLRNKNGNLFKKLMSFFKDDKFLDENRDKVSAFLKSINNQSYDDEDWEICGDERLKCPKKSSMCAGDGHNYYCKCREGYEPWGGDVINNKEGCVDQNAHVCKDTDCKSWNQKCIPKGRDFFCDCIDGFKLVDKFKKGTKEIRCEDQYVCKENDCKGWDQKCVPKGYDYFCDCIDGFRLVDESKKGTKEIRCEDQYSCKENDCKGWDQKCVSKGNDYFCDCIDGFQLVDESKKGTKEIRCEEEKCDCGEYSTACKRDGYGKPVCACLEGYSQYRDVCLDCFCGQHSWSCSFDYIGHKTCHCITGYAQRNITCAAMCKSNNDCLNGGICRYERNGYFCSCKEHYRGDRCETNEVCDSMMETCDAIGAVCIYNELLRKGLCECSPSRTFNRKLKTCEDICKPGSCVYGNCEVVDFHKECRCLEGYEGVDCEKKISKKTDNLDWNIVFVVLLSAITCFVILIFCIQINRKFKTSDKHCQCKRATMMEPS